MDRVRLALGATMLAVAIVCTGDEPASEYVEFSYDFHSECVARNGKMVLVRNTHPARTVKLYLYRYFADKRQPGRAVHTLQPNAEAVAVGCTVVQGLAQKWEVAKARFLH